MHPLCSDKVSSLRVLKQLCPVGDVEDVMQCIVYIVRERWTLLMVY